MAKATKNKATSPVRNSPGIVWNSANMRSTYANVISVTGDREEFSFIFGMNQSWGADKNELKVQLTDRIVVNPFSAKRLAKLLNDLIKDYESRYGTIHIETKQPIPAANRKITSKGSGVPTVHQSKTGIDSV